MTEQRANVEPVVMDGPDEYRRSNIREDLTAMRYALPFVPILPMPFRTVVVKVDSTRSWTVYIPRCAFVTLQSADNPCMVSTNSIPDLTAELAAAGDTSTGGVYVTPGMPAAGPFYAGNLSAIEARALGGNVVLVVHCYEMN